MSDEAARELFDVLHPHFTYGRHAEAMQAIAAALAAAREAAEQRERALREALEAIEEGAPDGATARLARAALEASR